MLTGIQSSAHFLIPNRLQAEHLLAESAALNPGPWEAHSRRVAQGAEVIAVALNKSRVRQYANLDPDRAYILGLLHDIGRRNGVTHMRHVLDGYHFLANLGYDGAARVCLTHSYPRRDMVEGATVWDGTSQELEFIRQYLASIDYDVYDLIIQLCDCIALPTGFCLMEKRLVDIAMRYGVNTYTIPRWQAYFEVKDTIETALDGSLYSLLPEVVENTFGV